MSSLRVTLAVCIGVLLLACQGAFAQAACGTSTNSCCVSSSSITPGCSNPTCCAAVCAADPFCCNSYWDNLCANAALTTCAVCQSCGSSPNACCVASPAALPYCSDGLCCTLVCSFDPFCCTNQWDFACGTEATQYCPSCGGTPNCGHAVNDCCVASTTNTPACSYAACCQTVCAADPFCCNTYWDNICANEALTMCTLCAPPACGNSPNNCCSTSSTPFCSDGNCCTLVCSFDPYCCTNNWDAQCSNEATQYCPNCGGTPVCGFSFNACCTATTTNSPACSNSACCQLVCSVDPYCCNNLWDGICANEANYWCATCSPYCPADLNLDGLVNGADLGILLSNWGGPGLGDINGSGTVDGADLGSLLANWGTCNPPA